MTRPPPTGPSVEVRRAFLNPAYDPQREPLETRRTPQYYARPYRSRISEYEQLLLYAQPNPDWIPGGLGLGGWRNKSPGGRGSWENYFTEAKCSDWFTFRDPSARGQQAYVAQKAVEGDEMDRLFATHTSQGLWRDLDQEWALSVLPTTWGAFAHHEYGLFMAMASPTRDALTDVLRVAIVTGALDHLDNAQMIQAEKIYLAQVVEGFEADVAPARELWLSSPIYHTARGVVEQVWGDVYDHIEALFVTYLVHEPLFGRFVRQQFFHRLAPLHGDTLTPAIVWSAITASEIDARWALELFGHTLAGDPKFGDYNRRLMRLWAGEWVHRSVEAMAEFAPTFLSTTTLRRIVSPDAVDACVRMVVEDWARRYASVFDLEVDLDALVRRIRPPRRAAGAPVGPTAPRPSREPAAAADATPDGTTAPPALPPRSGKARNRDVGPTCAR